MVAQGRGRTTSCPMMPNGRVVASPLPLRSPFGERTRAARGAAPTRCIVYPCPYPFDLFPILCDPRSRQHAAIPFAAAADERIGRIGQAMEDDNLCPGGNLRHLPKRERENFHAVLLEAATPSLGPITDLTLRTQVRGEELLLVAVTLAHGVQVRTEIFEDVRIRASAPAVNGRVAGVVALLPIADDEKITGLREERIDVADDDDVDVEEEDISFEFRAAGSSQRRRERDELGPTAFRCAGGQLKAGNRKGFDARIKPGLIISQADEPVGNTKVTLHHRVQSVDVFGAVLRAPLHAKDGRHTVVSVGKDRPCSSLFSAPLASPLPLGII